MALRLDFLRDVLGVEGAKALSKAVDREPALGGALELRAIIGWVSCLDTHEGSIPGTSSQLRLSKSDETYSGSVGDYNFTGESVYHVSAAVANALELEPGKLDKTLRDTVLMRLGKSLDLLIKSQLSKKKTKSKKTTAPNARPVDAAKQQFGVAAKAEALGTGPANPPLPQEAPMAAVPPSVKQPSVKKPKIPSLPLTRSEAAAECPLCGGGFMGGNKFVGCVCFSELAKSIRTTAYSDGYVLDFGVDVDADDVRSLMAALKG